MHASRRHILAAAGALTILGGAVALRALSEPKNDFRFSIMGDRTGSAKPQIFGRVWREVDLLSPDFVINVGDTIQGGNDGTAAAEWQAIKPVWQRYKQYHLYFTPGNHDIWSAHSRELYEKETERPAAYGFNYQDAHFTVLDNSRTLELSKEQLEFLEKDLTANAARSPKFIFFHKPYWIVMLKLGSSAFPLHEMALKHGVKYIVSGHGHQFVRMTQDGIAYMEVGSSGGTMDAGLVRGEGFRQGRFYHHVWVTVKGSQVKMTVKELDPPFGQGRMFRTEDWDAGGPRFDPADPAAIEKPAT